MIAIDASDWGSSFKALQVGANGAALVSDATASTRLYNNAYYDGTNLRYIGTGVSTQYLQYSDGSHRWYSANSQTAGNVISYSQSMMVDANGNVGIANASPSFRVVVGNTTPTSTATPETVSLGGTYSSTAGANPKLRLYWDTSSSIGLGVSASQLDYIVPSGAAHGFFVGGTIRASIDSNGYFVPGATATYDLGTASLRWRNVYTSDLHLNNGIGNYTIVEGEDDLFLYNNKNGKTYKFALTEVDPSTVPPKMKES